MSAGGKWCRTCGAAIPQERLQAVPNCTSCVKCSDTKRVGVVPIITGKTTYSELLVVDMETANRLNKAMRRQGQSPGAGMKGTAKVT